MASSDLLTKLHRLQNLMSKFPELAAVVAVNFSKERFVRKNWLGGDKFSKWEPRKQEDKGSLMVKSGRLKRSIRKLRVTPKSVVIGTDVPYAEIHNQGGSIVKTVNVKQHSRKRLDTTQRVRQHIRRVNTTMPERQFIGESKALTKRIERMLTKKITQILQQ